MALSVGPAYLPPCTVVTAFHVRAGGKKCWQAAFSPRDSRALVPVPQTDRASAAALQGAIMPQREP